MFMSRLCAFRLPHWAIILCAGLVAGVVSTLAQVLLWLLFSSDFPGILFRDARLAAALVLGTHVLPPPATFDVAVWIAATIIHFALSIVYAAMLYPYTARVSGYRALLAGTVFGVALYGVNFYGWTQVFPWFVQARGWIAAAAHVAFGLAAAVSCWFLTFRCGGRTAGGH